MTEADLMERVRDIGLSRVTGSLEPLIRPSIRITTHPVDEAALPVGTSKFGGLPDLPPDVDWPEQNGRPLDLIAQLNLDEITFLKPSAYQLSLLDMETNPATLDALPKSGLLYFFYNATDQPWGYKLEHQGGWKVVFYEGDVSRLERRQAASAFPEDTPLPACRLEFSREITLPNTETPGVDRLLLSRAEEEDYWRLVSAMDTSDETRHRLLGHAQAIQSPMEWMCAVLSHGLAYDDPEGQVYKGEETEWRLLLQVDSDENAGTQWGDMGRLYFWIKGADLKARKFDAIWLMWQCM